MIFLLTHNFLDHGASKLGELFVSTGMEVGELVVV